MLSELSLMRMEQAIILLMKIEPFHLNGNSKTTIMMK